ncbi:MAG TPA: CAP domain-containing protein [Gemmataceae bacterium]|jgi:uncharacterized protein YkwD|nr:CAP domain-containing protein [Gemmataceae bacterium]
MLRYWILLLLPCWFLLLSAALAEKPAPEPEVALSPEEKALVQLTNEARKKEDLPELKVNAKLMKAARNHSANMAKQEKMAHELDDKNPADRLKDLGYAVGHLGENVAFGQEKPQEAMETWMKSDDHRANILGKDFTEMGVGVAKSAKGTLYWTQVFARPPKPKPPAP